MTVEAKKLSQATTADYCYQKSLNVLHLSNGQLSSRGRVGGVGEIWIR